MKTVLVTGASGFIGQAAVKYLNQKGHHVIALVRDRAKVEFLKNMSSVNIVECQLCDYDKLALNLSKYRIDYAIHLAWSGNSGAQRSDVDLQMNNIKDTISLINILKNIGCRNILITGTISENLILDTKQQCNSASMIYASAKVSAYIMAKSLCNKIGMNFTWCRLANIYGPGNKTGNLMSYTIETLLAGQSPTYSSAMALQDFMYVEDCVKALYLIMKSEHKKSLYYVGTGHYRKLKEYVVDVQNIIAPNISLGFGIRPDENTIFRESWFSIKDLQNDTGFLPDYDFKSGIIKTLNILRS